MYARVLVPIDGSAASGRALREALELARHLGAMLVLLHVVDAYNLLLGSDTQTGFDAARLAMLEHGKALLEQHRQVVDAAGVSCEVVLREVLSSRISSAILEEARTRQCDLIVMGMHGRNGRTRLALGTDTEHVLRGARIPVLLVCAEAPEP
ncbi:universal stress protein [Azohydromonas caseinilytica]|uniref:Universal stress protein n=1 Tax=Azohydromonas caseinilytica TaxID=2728836 RepID=A0A848FHI9_9BURK|nr:universal stress protein [Azohydromonas caseinilytica]NML17660.1 universal stress protein [Azohydromonas caseinilytica]